MPGESIWRRLRRKRVAGVGVPAPVPERAADDKPDTKEAEALASALNRSAERVQTLWISFLVFALYLAIATSTTTHRMLFLESPIKLPVLNIDLPLLGFYILAPIIFVVFDFYVLLNLVLLARTAKSFEDTIQHVLPEDGDARENFRMRIENTIFVQLLVGGKPERKGFNGALLSLMALITLALAPVALILLLQITFLPYHSEAITWLHRGLLLADLLLVWTLWPGYRRGWGTRLWPQKSWRLAGYGVSSAMPLFYAVAIATFPDERMYLATKAWHSEARRDQWANSFAFGGKQDWYAWIAPINALDLRGQSLIDDVKLKNINEKNTNEILPSRWEPVLPLAKRDLTEANLSTTDIRQVDFSGAVLNRAILYLAWAENAHFGGAQLQGASLIGARLQGARFTSLWGLGSAQLQGASLDFAQLQGASLFGASLLGASLQGAELQGAELGFADLQGASLRNARLQGASFQNARLQGASFDSAQLQGASLLYAQLQGASFRNVLVWRADARTVAWENTRVVDPATDRMESCQREGKESRCEWTDNTFKKLKSLITETVPEGAERSRALERIEARLDPGKPLEGEKAMAQAWLANKSPTDEVYSTALAEQWQKTGCAGEGSPYVARALLERLDDRDESPFGENSPEPTTLAKAFLDPEKCPGARGLGEAEIAKLKDIRDRAPPPAPKP